MIYIRSIVYTALMFLSFVVLATIALLPMPIINYEKRWLIAKTWANLNIFLSKKLCGLSYNISGLESVPDQRCVVFVKHSSVYEIFVLLKHFSPSSWAVSYTHLTLPTKRIV